MKRIGGYLKRKALAGTVRQKKLFIELLNQDEEIRSEELFHLACVYDREDVVQQYLHDFSFPVNSLDKEGRPALFTCIRYDSVDCLNLLLKHGVDLNFIDQSGRSALMEVIDERNYVILDKLIASVMAEVINDGMDYCVKSRNTEAFAILADYPQIDLYPYAPKINFLDKMKKGVLYHAVKMGLHRAVMKLLFCGCKLELTDNLAESALQKGFYMVYNLLTLVGYSLEKKPIWKVVSGDSMSSGDTVHSFLERLKTAEEQELHVHCMNFQKDVELIEFFLDERVKSVTYTNCRLSHVPKSHHLLNVGIHRCVVNSFETLTACESMCMLCLTECNFKFLPTLQNLPCLTFLSISKCRTFEELPIWIKDTKLTTLLVNNCRLSKIPDLLPKTLKVLKAEGNQIVRLSPLLSKLKNLVCLSVKGNPITFPKPSIVQKPTHEVLQYLHAFLGDTVPNRSLKISVIGKEECGKSSLVESLHSSKGLCEPDSIEKTDGLKISTLPFNGIDIRFFDLAGDVEFIETHSLFFSTETLFIVAFDLRTYSLNTTLSTSSFFARVEVWLSTIFATCPHARVILVGTHADSDIVSPSVLKVVWQNIESIFDSARFNHRRYFTEHTIDTCLLCSHNALQRQHTNGVAGYVTVRTDVASQLNDQSVEEMTGVLTFPHIVGYFEVSNTYQIPRRTFSRKNASIEQLRTFIQTTAESVLFDKPPIPREWTSLHEILIKHTEGKFPLLSYKELEEIVKRCDLDTDDLLPFLQHFHSNGDLLYYSDIKDLNDVIITEPQWLSDQLRKVVSYHVQPCLEQGIISHQSLAEIWSDLDELLRTKLLNFFRQTGLFIKFSQSSEMLPFRLPVGRPSEDMWTTLPCPSEQQMDFCVEFDNLPSSLFPFVISGVESRYSSINSKCKPLYLQNCIVYMIKSKGVPCEIHTEDDCVINMEENGVLNKGVPLVRFLSIDAISVDSLIDKGIDSYRCSMIEDSIHIESVVEETRHKIQMTMEPHRKSICVSIRGPKPCCMAPETIHMINSVRLSRYAAVNVRHYLLCPICVRKKLAEPSRFDLKREVNKQEPVCSKGHDLIDWRRVLTGRCEYAPTLTSEEIVTNLNDFQSPRLFTLMPINLNAKNLPQFFTYSYLKEGYAVHLLCEYPGCWHFLQKCPGYRLSRPKDFVKKYGNRMKTLLRVLGKLEAPAKLAAPVTGEMAAEACAKMTSMAASLEIYLEDFRDEYTCFASEEDDMKLLQSSEGLNRREFARFLNAADEQRKFGDLLPAFVGGNVLWVCQEHYKMLRVVK